MTRLGGTAGVEPPVYRVEDPPGAQAAGAELVRRPSFPSAERPLLDAYVTAFEKVLAQADEIGSHMRKEAGTG